MQQHIIVTGTGTAQVCATMPVEMTLHTSRAISAYHYNGISQTLTVVYRERNKKGENAIYQFFGVDRCLFDKIFSSESVGRALREEITHNKNKKFPYWKVAGYHVQENRA